MKLHITVRAVVMSLCFSLLASGEAEAVSFTFTKIADTRDSFSSFFAGASINNQGTVAFGAELDAGGSGIFTSDGTTTTTIADTSDLFSSFYDLPSINDVGTVAFAAELDERNGIFTGNGTTTTTIETVVSDISGDDYLETQRLSSPAINKAGTVAYDFATPNTSAIRVGNGTSVEQIADAERFFAVTSPDINDAGTVAFIVSGNGPTTINAGKGQIYFDEYVSASPPAINNAGTVAFTADIISEDSEGEGIFTSDGATITTIADTSASFSSFLSSSSAPSINDLGTVAFLAELDAGGIGIFTSSNSQTDKVITTGDTLLDSTVTELAFFREGLNNVGQVAFFATLANGISGIFRANPQDISEPPTTVPEPSSSLGTLAFVAFGAGSLLKRK